MLEKLLTLWMLLEIQQKLLPKGMLLVQLDLGALVLFAAYTEDIKFFSNVSGSPLENISVNFDLI